MSTNIERSVSNAPKHDPIFEDANDQHVRGIKIYTKTADTFAYADSACTVKFTAAQLENLFMVKGCVVVALDGTMYKPVSCKTVGGVVTLTYVKTNTSTATTADLATVKSEG